MQVNSLYRTNFFNQNIRFNPNNRCDLNKNTNYADTVSFSGKTQNLKSPDMPLKDFKKATEEKVSKINDANKMEVVSELTEVLDLYLQNKWDAKTQPGKKEIVLDNLKKIMGERGQGNMVVAQINPVPGDIEGNAKKVMTYIKTAEIIGIDTVVFPELTLMGYPIHDLIDRYPFIVKQNVLWMQEIAKRTGKTKAIVGFVEPRLAEPGQKWRGKEFFNSVAVLGNGKIEGVVRKSLLPTYGEFNDYRYNEPSPASGVQPPESLTKASWGVDKKPESGKPADIHGHKYGIAICEDGWNDKNFFDNFLYERDPIAELMENKPEVLINCSASPTRDRKEQFKHNMLSYIAKKYMVPYVYVNQVGAIDSSSFDGASRVYDANGELISRAKSFTEQFQIVNPIKGEGKVYELPKGLEKTLSAKKKFSLDYENDLARTYETVIQGIRDYFNKTGFKRAVLGLSGGLDSAVNAVLLADALGPENVLAISLPSKITAQESNIEAEELAKNLGINYLKVPISEMVTAGTNTTQKAFNDIEKFWGKPPAETTTKDNLQARTRATILWQIANEYPGTLPIATSDKSELYIGYATINGDMSGGFAPTADILKTKSRALARWLNLNRQVKNAIPENTIVKPSGAELAQNEKTGKTVTADEVNGPEAFRDEIIWRCENLHQSSEEMMKEDFLAEKMSRGEFKPKNIYEKDAHNQIKNFLTETYGEYPHPITKEQKQAWMDKFFSNMPKAVFKWSIMPPSVLVDAKSINSADYRQPITSGGISWKQATPEQIGHKLDQAA